MTNTISVPSVDEFSKKVIEKGGQLIVPKTAISRIGWFAQCIDTEGNAFGVIEMNENTVTPPKLIIRKNVKYSIELQVFRACN